MTDSLFPSPRVRPLLALIIASAILVLLWFHPPFVIRPMPSATGSGTAGPASTPDPAVAFVEPIWATKIIPTVLAKAVDAGTLLPEIHANPDAAGEKYGRREATNPFNYMIKGSGKVTQVNTQSRAGTMAVEVDTGNGHSRETINLQIGPVVIGTALRDATGLVSFNQFTNQIDFAGISKEMNSRAIKEALAGRDPASFKDKTVQFFGVFTFDPKSTNPIRVTPVKLTTAN